MRPPTFTTGSRAVTLRLGGRRGGRTAAARGVRTGDMVVLFDEAGRHVGRIVAPDAEPRLGRGADTLLLTRDF